MQVTAVAAFNNAPAISERFEDIEPALTFCKQKAKEFSAIHFMLIGGNYDVVWLDQNADPLIAQDTERLADWRAGRVDTLFNAQP